MMESKLLRSHTKETPVSLRVCNASHRSTTHSLHVRFLRIVRTEPSKLPSFVRLLLFL